MSTQVKHFALAKVATAVVAVAMIAGLLFAYATPRAQAVTMSELIELFIALDIIAEDKADEARAVLDNQGGNTGTTGGGSSACTTTFTRNLTTGNTGADVKALQMLLNQNPATQVASVGAGSPGAETMYFGPATKAAVMKFQNMYASEVLAPLGLTAGTGYFGASTRAKANMMCTSGGGDNGGGAPAPGGGTPPPPPPGPGGDDDDDDNGGNDDDDNSGGSLGGGEASLEDFDSLGSPSNEDLEEGDEDVAVFGFEFDVEDADAEVKRVDVAFEGKSNSDCNGSAAICEDEPWESIDEVSLWIDGEKVAMSNADDEDDWDDQGSDIYEIRMTGIDDSIFREDETAEILVGVTINDNIDDSDLNQTWDVWIPAEGLRAVDGAGIDQYTGSASEKKSFNIETVGGDAELNVSEDSSSPDASTIKVDDNDTTDDVVLNVANFEAEDGDLTIDELTFTAETQGSSTVTFDDVFSDIWVEINGERNDDTSITGNTTATATVVVDLDDDLEIEEDEEVEIKIVADLLKQDPANYDAGQQIKAGFTSANADATSVEDDGGNDLGAARIGGSATGEFHTLVAEGIFAEIVSTDADATSVDSAADYGTFVVKFDITAFEEDAYVNDAAFRGSSALSGVVYQIEDNQGVATTGGSASAVVSSTGDQVSGEEEINDGDTEEFTLTITYTPGSFATGQFFRAEMLSVNFASTPGGTVQTHDATPDDDDFETDYVNIQA